MTDDKDTLVNTILPKDYTYNVSEVTIESDLKFSAKFRVLEITDENEFYKWFELYKKSSKTGWITSRTNFQTSSKSSNFAFARDYMCLLSSRNKTKDSARNLSCPTTLRVRIKKDTKYVRYRDTLCKDGYFGIIEISTNHTHPVENAEALNFLRVSAETEKTFELYFQQGVSAAEAKRLHEKILRAQPNGVLLLADSSLNPPKKWLHYKFKLWRDLQLGGVKLDTDFFEKLQNFKGELQEKGHSVEVSENPYCVAIITPLMKRNLQYISKQKVPVPVFTDSSSNCDQTNCSMTTFMVPTKGGAVPIGVLLHSNQNTVNYTHGMQIMKGLWRPYSFDISCFVSDDSKALKSALENVWPTVRQLLCQFHVVSAVWNWLFAPSNCIPKNERKSCIISFRELMYAISKKRAQELFDKLLADFKKYQKFCSYIAEMFTRREQWCFCYRRDVLNRAHNTNNFAEITFRIFKDLILLRLKAHNSLSLLSFIACELDEYYCSRLTDVAFGRGLKNDKIWNLLRVRAQRLIDCFGPKFQEIGVDSYLAPSSDGETMYEINSSLATCTCVSGCQGAFCKHQCAIGLLYNKNFINCPLLNAKDKQSLYYIANGTTHKIDFFASLKRKLAEPENKENVVFPDNPIDCLPDSENDWTDCEEPEGKKSKYDSDCDLENVKNGYDECVANWRRILCENGSDTFLVKSVKRLSAIGSKHQTGVQLASFVNNAIERHRRGGKKIQVQPMNVNRRKGQSKSRRVQRSGRPLGGVKAPIKRKRHLALNISLNQLNAKSHGQGH